MDKTFINPSKIIVMFLFEEGKTYNCKVYLQNFEKPIWLYFPSEGERNQFVKTMDAGYPVPVHQSARIVMEGKPY
jgi:hypothetical protein